MVIPDGVVRLLGELRNAHRSVPGSSPHGRRLLHAGSRECEHATREFLGLLDMGKVAGAVDRLEACTRNGRTISTPVIFTEDAVGGAPKEQRWNANAMQPRLELGIVHVRRPAESRRGFPIA